MSPRVEAVPAAPVATPVRRPRLRPVVRRRLLLGFSTLARLALAAVWPAAGILKIRTPEAMVRSVRAFRILPESLVHPVGYAVPWVEIALGLLLLAGLSVRTGAIVSALLLTIYVAAIISASARGLRIECGCFSAGGDLKAGAATHYTAEIVRDSLLALLAVLLALRPRGVVTVDNWLAGPIEESA